MSEALTPISVRRPLKGLAAGGFQHPSDRQAIEALQKIRGFEFVVGKFVEYGVERVEYIRNMGGSIRVGPRQMPQLYGMLLEACKILDVEEPELYVQVGDMNAYTSGHNAPFIVLQTAVIELMEDDEVFAIMAHELGHIKCGHVLYKAMARMIGPFLEMLGELTFGLGKLIGAGFEAALLAWDRCSELSADRAALLATQDPGPCIRMLMKLAGGNQRLASQLDAEQFLNQSRAYKEGMDQKLADRFYRFIVSRNLSHPFSVERARALDEWASTPGYRAILEGNAPIASPVVVATCPTCSQSNPVTAKFCGACGTPLLVR
jgi:Zn-dependent protease with chaperone function